MKSITIEIPLEGDVKIEAHGFKGCGCTDATKVFEQALAGNITSHKKKPEHWVQIQNVAQQKIGG